MPYRLLFCLLLAAITPLRADVTINEISATQPDRLLRWDETNQPYAGSGAPWWSTAFDDSHWQSGPTPIGFNLGTIATNLSATVMGVTPSVYVRKTFTVSAADANSGSAATLSINCNDGFIVWINGAEATRCNMGAANAHIYVDQLAYREAGNSTAATNINLGAANNLLVQGENTVAIQVANYDIDSSLRLEMSLTVGGATLLPFGSTVKYLPGLIEATSDLHEPAAPLAGTADWIELHNNGAAAVDLSAWTLSDDPTGTIKWTFPSGTSIAAGAYLLVLADAPDAPIPGAQFLHADFKLSASGEYLRLSDNTDAVVDEIAPEFPKQFRFYSYGRHPISGQFGYLGVPSPGEANTGPTFTDKVDAPDFDIEGGFFPTTVTVTLTTETAGATIRYTTDGTEPSLSNGTDYSTPLSLAKITNKKGHVVRARAFLNGMIPSNTKTNTYLIDQDSRLRTAPALVYSADLPRSLYDPYGVLAINGGNYVNNNQWQPTAKTDYNNVFNRGRAYERPIHVEYYFADGSPGFRTDCGVRIAASSYSRPRMQLSSLNSSPWPDNPVQKPSFNLYFRDEYGNPDVNLPLNGENAPVNTFEQFRVRAGKNDIRNPFYIDELIRRLSRDMGQTATTGVINTLYVNAEIKGFYNLVERLREPFFRAHYGSDSNVDWDVLQFEGNDNIAAGDKIAWDEMISRLNAPETLENWGAAIAYVDPVNVADYFILNIYSATWDWPHNNWVAARERSERGRYRLFVWDAEGAMDNAGNRGPNTNMIDSYILGGQNGAGGQTGTEGELRDLWRGLNRWEEFRILFADRINKHLFNGGVLDDRDFDNSHIALLNGELVEEFDDLLSFMNNQTVNANLPKNWATGTNARRNYLFGPNRESFRDHGLWPNVTPPQFSQLGGVVTTNTPLNITNVIGDIYYTTDGSDPRMPSGQPNPNATSQPGSTIDVDLLNRGSVWKYHDSGEDLGTAWRGVGYDDQTWSAGPSPLGYGESEIVTTINITRNLTAYVRRTFEVDDAQAYFELETSIQTDGGCVVYINGVEALRDGMPEGEITYNTISSTDGNEGIYDVFDLDSSLLVTGTNTIAIEIHNRTPGSSDMFIDLEIDGKRTNPNSPPYSINEPVTVRARSFDGTTWSAITEADFTVDTIPATTTNLAITEMLYNPAGPSVAEAAAGFNDGDLFEFLQIKNTDNQAIDLHGVRFTDGINFDFGNGATRALAPGARALIVSNLAAFQARYGNAFDSIIAGEYTGKLNNGGEHLRLIDTNGAALHDFDFKITEPWPNLSSLDGHSIQLIDTAAPHADGANWRASTEPGGNPGGSGLTFAAWQTANFTNPAHSAAHLDPDNDGRDNFTEFALGTPPLSSSNGVPVPSGSIETAAGEDFLVLEFTRGSGEREVDFALESSSDLATWTESTIPSGTPVTNEDGTITSKIRDAVPASQRRYVRLKMSSP